MLLLEKGKQEFSIVHFGNSHMLIEISRLQYLERQHLLYEDLKPSLLAKYSGQFIAFEDGVVLDFDSNEKQLAQRVYQTYGYRDLLILQVLEKEPQLSVASAMKRLGDD
jgi:hypothetical protein